LGAKIIRQTKTGKIIKATFVIFNVTKMSAYDIVYKTPNNWEYVALDQTKEFM